MIVVLCAELPTGKKHPKYIPIPIPMWVISRVLNGANIRQTDFERAQIYNRRERVKASMFQIQRCDLVDIAPKLLDHERPPLHVLEGHRGGLVDSMQCVGYLDVFALTFVR